MATFSKTVRGISPMTRRLNVLIATSVFPNSYEPTKAIFSHRIARELTRHCDITVLAPIPWVPQSRLAQLSPKWRQAACVPIRENIGGIEVYHPRYAVIPKVSGFAHGFSMYFPLRNLIRQLYRQKKIDVINARWVFPDGFAATLIADKMGIPIVVSALGCDINLYTDFWLRKRQIIYALRKADLVSTVSSALREKTIDLGISPAKVRCIYNGIDRTMFYPRDQRESRERLQLKVKDKIILFVGAMDPVKGVECLIRAIAQLSKNGREDFYLVLVGDGFHRGVLEQAVEHLDLKQKVFFAGRKPHEEIVHWINASDMLCLPSIREGRPNVVIEALACGKPVVASRVGGIPELVNHTNGILVTPNQPGELARAIAQALDRKWSPERIVDSVQNLSWQACAEQFMLAYESLVNHRAVKV